jgi:hypothetical protein
MELPPSLKIILSIGAFVCILAGLVTISRGLQSRNLSRSRKAKGLTNLRSLPKGKLKLAGAGVLLLLIGTGLVGALIFPDSGNGATPIPIRLPTSSAPTPEPRSSRFQDPHDGDLSFGAPTKDVKSDIPTDETPKPRR